MDGLASCNSRHDSRPWLIWVISVSVWALLALSQILSRFEYSRLMASRFSGYDIGTILVRCGISALLTPVVFRLAQRYPIDRNQIYSRVPAYLLGGLAFTAVQEILRGLLYPVREMPGISLPLFEHLFLYCVVEDVFQVYAPIVVFAQTLSYYQRLKTREVQLARAQLQMLKAKLHPHFLFNAMHSISALMFRDVKAADKMMSRLSDLLRLMLQNENTQETTLIRELEFVNVYLELEKVRFDDRLQVIVDADPATLNARVPHLVLQPLVENAIRHGVSKRIENGRILITSTYHDGSLHLVVADNGPGLEHNAKSGRIGLGLGTTRKRLQALYGNQQSLTIHELPEGGVEACVSVPFRIINGSGEALERMEEEVAV